MFNFKLNIIFFIVFYLINNYGAFPINENLYNDELDNDDKNQLVNFLSRYYYIDPTIMRSYIQSQSQNGVWYLQPNANKRGSRKNVNVIRYRSRDKPNSTLRIMKKADEGIYSETNDQQNLWNRSIRSKSGALRIMKRDGSSLDENEIFQVEKNNKE